MPASARLSAGASFTPSPVIATDKPFACKAVTRRSLCSGLVRAKMSTRGDLQRQLRIVELVEIGPGQHAVRVRQPDLCGDGQRRCPHDRR